MNKLLALPKELEQVTRLENLNKNKTIKVKVKLIK